MTDFKTTPDRVTEEETHGSSERSAADLEAQVGRLREIERAARVYFREFDHLIGNEDYPERRDLRDALASMPEDSGAAK